MWRNLISKSSLLQFKRLYQQEYGEEITNKKAYELASNLVNLYRAVYLNEEESISQKYETQSRSSKNQS